ncbi:MAG: 16S rRNA (cytosine(967)-C(5))-methyltransferase RsmB [Ignavibacteriae bacterium]|nr:MAG: 16S rRNA (cytosine(967)-C(5))-methyltransferase RsmB [Ignavibacteriota bacterium]
MSENPDLQDQTLPQPSTSPQPQSPAQPANVYNGPRGTAVKILNRIERSDSYLDKLLDAELRSEDMNELDKGLMNEIVTGVIRWKMKLDWVLTGFFHGNFTKAETNIKNALRVALYQIQFLDRVPHSAAVNEAVEFIKRLRGQKAADLVNAILRNIIRNIDNIRYPDPEEDKIRNLAVIESHPIWMTKRWVERYGYDDTKKMMAANNAIPDLALRVNRLKVDINYFLSLLEKHQIQYSRSPYLDYFVRVQHMAGIGSSELFQQGYFSVQDESAGIPVLLLDPKPGERIIDLCSAPGGKTTFIGELMKNIGEIIAVDRYETRLHLVKNACQRLGITIAHLVTEDGATIDIPPADKVLVDAPCSGLGVLSKKPDAKWQRDADDIVKLMALQKTLIDNAARLVKGGGLLVYSTCTIEPEENMNLIREFLERHPEFSVESARPCIHQDLVGALGQVETFRHKHGMDGSFSIRLRKK